MVQELKQRFIKSTLVRSESIWGGASHEAERGGAQEVGCLELITTRQRWRGVWGEEAEAGLGS